MVTYTIPKVLNRKERRRIAKEHGVKVGVNSAGLPADYFPEPEAPAWALTEEEALAMAPEIRQCLRLGVDTEGYRMLGKMRLEYERILRDRLRDAEYAKRARMIMAGLAT